MASAFRMPFQPLVSPVGFDRLCCRCRGGEVEHLQRGLLVREVPAAADRLPEPGVEALDRVGGVHDPCGARAGNSRNGVNSPQARSPQSRSSPGSARSTRSANSSKRASAASTVGAV